MKKSRVLLLVFGLFASFFGVHSAQAKVKRGSLKVKKPGKSLPQVPVKAGVKGTPSFKQSFQSKFRKAGQGVSSFGKKAFSQASSFKQGVQKRFTGAKQGVQSKFKKAGQGVSAFGKKTFSKASSFKQGVQKRFAGAKQGVQSRLKKAGQDVKDYIVYGKDASFKKSIGSTRMSRMRTLIGDTKRQVKDYFEAKRQNKIMKNILGRMNKNSKKKFAIDKQTLRANVTKQLNKIKSSLRFPKFSLKGFSKQKKPQKTSRPQTIPPSIPKRRSLAERTAISKKNQPDQKKPQEIVKKQDKKIVNEDPDLSLDKMMKDMGIGESKSQKEQLSSSQRRRKKIQDRYGNVKKKSSATKLTKEQQAAFDKKIEKDTAALRKQREKDEKAIKAKNLKGSRQELFERQMRNKAGLGEIDLYQKSSSKSVKKQLEVQKPPSQANVGGLSQQFRDVRLKKAKSRKPSQKVSRKKTPETPKAPKAPALNMKKMNQVTAAKQKPLDLLSQIRAGKNLKKVTAEQKKKEKKLSPIEQALKEKFKNTRQDDDDE